MNTIAISGSLHQILNGLKSDCPCVRALMKGISKQNEGRKGYLLNIETMGNFFSMRERDGMISFMPAGRNQTFTDDGKWERKGRQEIKPAKWIRAMLNPKLLRRFKDSDLAKFAERFQAAENSERITFDFVPFADGYNEERYITGIHSCMWGEDVSSFYDCFPAKLLVAKRGDGKFAGRAIVWTLADGMGLFMDRVYSASPDISEMFFEYAKQNGMMRKARQSTGTARQVLKQDGSESLVALKVQGFRQPDHDGFFPYCDTLFGYDGGRVLRNSEDCEYKLDSTNGELPDNHEGEVEDVDGSWISEDDAISVNGDYYESGDDRIAFCERSEEYVMACDTYTIEVSRSQTVTVHRDYVTQN